MSTTQPISNPTPPTASNSFTYEDFDLNALLEEAMEMEDNPSLNTSQQTETPKDTISVVEGKLFESGYKASKEEVTFSSSFQSGFPQFDEKALDELMRSTIEEWKQSQGSSNTTLPMPDKDLELMGEDLEKFLINMPNIMIEEVKKYEMNPNLFLEKTKDEVSIEKQMLQQISSMVGENVPEEFVWQVERLSSSALTERTISYREKKLFKLGIEEQKCKKMVLHKDFFPVMKVATFHACSKLKEDLLKDVIPIIAKGYSDFEKLMNDPFFAVDIILVDPRFSSFKENYISYLLEKLTE